MKTNTINLMRKPFFVAGILVGISLITFFIFNRVYREQILVNMAFFEKKSIPSPVLSDIVKDTLEHSPKQADLTFLYRLSAVLLKEGMKNESIQILNQALKVEPGNLQMKVQFAIELFNEGRYEEAEKSFSELLQLNRERTK